MHLVLAIAVSFLAGIVPLGRILSFQRTFAFYPLFVIGYYLKPQYCKLRGMHRSIPLAIISLYALAIIFTSIPPISALLQRTPYDTDNIGFSILSKGFFYAWTIPISLSVISLFPDVKLLSKEGKFTLFYYMYHMFFVLLFRYLVFNTSLECNIMTVLIYAAMAFIMMFFLRHITVFTLLVNPILYLRK